MRFKFSQSVLSVILILMGLSANATEAKIPVYTQGAKQITISKQNPSFYIALDSNPTTGYIITLAKIDSEKLNVVQHRYLPDENNAGLIGAGGKAQWLIKATPKFLQAQGRTQLEFHYGRPWQAGVFSTKVFNIVSVEQVS